MGRDAFPAAESKIFRNKINNYPACVKRKLFARSTSSRAGVPFSRSTIEGRIFCVELKSNFRSNHLVCGIVNLFSFREGKECFENAKNNNHCSLGQDWLVYEPRTFPRNVIKMSL